jgi:hypothetical protein
LNDWLAVEAEMRTISSSNGVTLVFPDDELAKEYADNLELLHIQTYKKIRDKYGVFAGNNNKFVESRENLSAHDPRFMENLYDRYYDTE